MKNCLCSLSCNFVKNYFFTIKLLHANVKHVSIVFVKFQSCSWKTVVGVDWPMKAYTYAYKHSHLELQRAITLTELAPSPLCVIIIFAPSICMCVQGFMKFRPRGFKILRKTKCYGRSDERTDGRRPGRTDGRTDNVKTVLRYCGGYNKNTNFVQANVISMYAKFQLHLPYGF